MPDPSPHLLDLIRDCLAAGAARERHPDLFDPAEAMAYLHLPPASERTLKNYRDKGWLIGTPSGPDGSLMYYRDDLNACALRMAGRTGRNDGPRPTGPQLRRRMSRQNTQPPEGSN